MNRSDIEEGLKLVPAHLQSGLRDYFLDRVKPGDFLAAVLENDFAGAVLRADPLSYQSLKQIARFLHNDVPPRSHGSREAVAAWLEGEPS